MRNIPNIKKITQEDIFKDATYISIFQIIYCVNENNSLYISNK